LQVPPMGTYFIAVRAKDEVGNYSDFVAPVALPNPASQIVLLTPTAIAGQSFGLTATARGSVNNDSLDDLVIGAPTTSNGGVVSGAVYVYFGGSSLANQSTCVAPECQKLVAYDSATVANDFGADLSMGNVGDIGTENKPDVLVAAPAWSSAVGNNEGRAFLFFGTASQGTLDLASYVEFRGNLGSNLAASAQILPNIDLSPDGYSEIAFSAHTELSGQGRVYIFKGRSSAGWTAAATGTDSGSGRKFVPLSAADIVIEGPLPVVAGGVPGNQFGRNRTGFAWLGDLDADGRGDFAVPDSKDSTINKSFLFTGAKVASSALLKTGNLPTTPNDALQTITAPFTAKGNRFGFGATAIGSVDVIGATAKDLLVAQPTGGKLHIFGDGTATGFSSIANVTVQGNAVKSFAYSLAVSDLNGDGKADVIAGEGSIASNSVWVLYSRAGSFDGATGAGFYQSRIQGPATSAFGRSLCTGDFNGDGTVDVAITDDYDAPGRVTIWK
ncbi:MAG: FG-GAP-like repeat-containing protein, partial [Myxococcaceae bacterium]